MRRPQPATNDQIIPPAPPSLPLLSGYPAFHIPFPSIPSPLKYAACGQCGVPRERKREIPCSSRSPHFLRHSGTGGCQRHPPAPAFRIISQVYFFPTCAVYLRTLDTRSPFEKLPRDSVHPSADRAVKASTSILPHVFTFCHPAPFLRAETGDESGSLVHRSRRFHRTVSFVVTRDLNPGRRKNLTEVYCEEGAV